ncbi:MAG: hypothetical protein A2156_01395 [Deltaproteobacteria bacterium RBG_16_48_10]|nr:MAG: hypothetical protein A2156_01395 [Deltaproteobacteria bacterium RBG_16_48_10]
MLDGILLEKHDLPAVSIITDGFIETARAIAQSWGVPDYKFLTIPHPISNLTSEELDQRAREVTPRIVDFLLKGQE